MGESSAPSSFIEQESPGLQLHLFDHLGLFFHPGLRRLRLIHPLPFSVCGRFRVCSFLHTGFGRCQFYNMEGLAGVSFRIGGLEWGSWVPGGAQTEGANRSPLRVLPHFLPGS